MSKTGKFVFGGMNAADYGIIMTAPPPIIFAERETKTASVAGSSGDLHIDMGRYKNVTVSYRCALIPPIGQTLRQAAIAAVSAMRTVLGYNKLVNDFDANTYRMARIGADISVESIVEKAGTFTIDFDCKPQRYLVSGDQEVTFTATGTLYNPTACPARPLITVYGTAAGTVTVGDVTVQIKSIGDQITLDCEAQNAYRSVGGVTSNANGNIYAMEFPELSPGSNAIRWTGGITKIVITPRWWTL